MKQEPLQTKWVGPENKSIISSDEIVNFQDVVSLEVIKPKKLPLACKFDLANDHCLIILASILMLFCTKYWFLSCRTVMCDVVNITSFGRKPWKISTAAGRRRAFIRTYFLFWMFYFYSNSCNQPIKGSDYNQGNDG